MSINYVIIKLVNRKSEVSFILLTFLGFMLDLANYELPNTPHAKKGKRE